MDVSLILLTEKLSQTLKKLIKKASETADLAIVILSPQDSSLSTKEYKERTFKNYSFSSLIIDSMPQHLIYPKIWSWAFDNTHLKINGYIILYFLGGMSLYPCNFLDVKDFLSHSDVDKALKILDEPIGTYPTPLLSPLL